MCNPESHFGIRLGDIPLIITNAKCSIPGYKAMINTCPDCHLQFGYGESIKIGERITKTLKH